MNTSEAINYSLLDRESLLIEIVSKDNDIQEKDDQIQKLEAQLGGRE